MAQAKMSVAEAIDVMRIVSFGDSDLKDQCELIANRAEEALKMMDMLRISGDKYAISVTAEVMIEWGRDLDKLGDMLTICQYRGLI